MTSYRSFQDSGHTVTNLLPFSGMVMSHVSEVAKLFAYQISTRYLSARLRYYYFRFLKQMVAILNFYFDFYTDLSPSSACDPALAYQILSKLNDRGRSYDVISILQDGGHSVANLLPVSSLATCDI